VYKNEIKKITVNYTIVKLKETPETNFYNKGFKSKLEIMVTKIRKPVTKNQNLSRHIREIRLISLHEKVTKR